MHYSYPITIRQIFISPGHNYFGHTPEEPGQNPIFDLEKVEAKAGLGLVGDRFYGLKKGFDGQITFFSWEVFRHLAEQPGLSEILPKMLRRNIIIQGVHLNALIGHDFEIRAGSGSIERENADQQQHQQPGVCFRGARHCNPCRWMDIGVGDGALKFLKGRGGLRAQIQSDGTLHSGAATLYTDVQFEPSRAIEPLVYPRLP